MQVIVQHARLAIYFLLTVFFMVNVSFADQIEYPFTYETVWDYNEETDEETVSVTITGYLEGGDLVIPSEINGYAVTCIGPQAFYDAYDLKSLVIPASVSVIESMNFASYERMRGIHFLGNAPTVVADDVLRGSRLLTVYYTPGTEGWESGSWFGRPALPLPFTYLLEDDQTVLTGYTGINNVAVVYPVIMGRRVKSLSDSLFSGCTELTDVTLPAYISNIGHGVFSNCENLRGVYFLGDAPLSIGTNLFNDTQGVTVYRQPSTIGWEPTLSGRPVSILPMTYNMDGLEVTFTGYECACTGEVALVSQIGGFPVTSIGYFAFLNATQMTGITLPDSVSSIGAGAFLGCTGLRDVEIPDGVVTIGQYAFADCNELTDVRLGQNVGELMCGAFSGCKALRVFEISNAVRVLGEQVFDRCLSLSEITLGTNLKDVGISAFSGCKSLSSLTVPAGVTNVGSWAFSECVSMKECFIPDTVTHIGYYAFDSCVTLTNISVAVNNTSYSSPDGVLMNRDRTDLVRYPPARPGDFVVPASVTRISAEAFSGCFSLSHITMPSGLVSIGDYAFENCIGLSEIALPSSVGTIGKFSFAGCLNVTNFLVDVGNTSYSSSDGVLFNKAQTVLIRYPMARSALAYTVPSGVVSLLDCAFNGCENLVELSLPSTLSSVGDCVFDGCDSLETFVVDPANAIYYSLDGILFRHVEGYWSTYELLIRCPNAKAGPVSVPDNVRYIVDHAFYGCAKLTAVTIPSSVWNIYADAFSGCNSLEFFETDPADDRFVSVEGMLCRRYSWPTEHYRLICCPDGKRGSCVIPANLTDLEGVDFLGCSKLTAFEVDSSNAYWGSDGGVLYEKNSGALTCCPRAKAGEVLIPDSIESIDSGAFGGCSELTRVTIPASVREIGDYAFSACDKLSAFFVDQANDHFQTHDGVLFDGTGTRLLQYPAGRTNAEYTVSASVSYVDELAFAGSTHLRSVMFKGNCPVAYGCGVFLHAKDVTAYYLPGAEGWNEPFLACRPAVLFPYLYDFDDAGVTISVYAGAGGTEVVPSVIEGRPVVAIGPYAFFGCDELTNVVVSEGVMSIDESAFEYCGELRSVTIASSVVTIENHAFANCDALYELSLPDGLSAIGDGVFVNCTALQGIKIPPYVSGIGDWTFSGCEGLIQMTLPCGITTIGNHAFDNCTGLSELYFEGNAPLFGWEPFSGMTELVAYYRAGSSGWDQTVAGVSFKLWNPRVVDGVNFGWEGEQRVFYFSVAGEDGMSVRIETCTNLSLDMWQSLQTMTLDGGVAGFSDQTSSAYSSRFYRFKMP